MRKFGDTFQLNASDLVGHLNCQHLTLLDRAVAEGRISKPKVWDPLLQILSERGTAHEQAYIEHLQAAGFSVARIEGVEVTEAAVAETIAAMQGGVQTIIQGALRHGNWIGRADVLRRVDTKPSRFGSWSYEAIDTKLARETKAGAVLQLCLYSDLLAHTQEAEPELMCVVAPWSDFVPQQFRYADCAAYFRKVKGALTGSMCAAAANNTYPDPKNHCDICRWRDNCDKRRREDDHLSLVANISKIQIEELKSRGVSTLAQLASVPLPLSWKPDRGSPDSYVRIREQARLQYEARETGERKIEILPVEQGFGLCCLPAPSAGDIFLDFEADPFVGEHGIEFLFGYVLEEDNHTTYTYHWAFTREDEKKAFETFVDLVMARLERFPDLHIYHYAPYEPAALKRLMGRYATREEEIDRMLRARLFVDLFGVVRRALRASVESYSIKQMEPFFSFERQTPLSDARTALAALQAGLELGDVGSISDDAKEIVRAYNEDDCRSAAALRDWLEQLRANAVASGTNIPRPELGDGSPNDKITDWLRRIQPLIEKLTEDVPADPTERSDEQHGRWVLANVLDFHRREEKANWWEYFRLSTLAPDDLMDERPALSGLRFVADVPPPAGSRATTPVHRYSFPPQDTDLRGDEDLRAAGGKPFGKVHAISFEDRTIDIKKSKTTASLHVDAIFAHTHVPTDDLSDALARLAEYVVDHGLAGDGPMRAARDLLLKNAPRTGGEPLMREGETATDAAVRLCAHLQGGILPIQGPPGAGKTYTGARMICELVRQGKTVGVTANSHKVIQNLLDAVIQEATEQGVAVTCGHKTKESAAAKPMLTLFKDNPPFIGALGNGIKVGGGTAWLWCLPNVCDAIDVLFVDEAAQMSLANVLAVAQSAKTIVLLGDPQQLDQPMKGTHPDDIGVSALTHILDGAHTVSADKGLFLEHTWRLHPEITAFTSELFYDGKLRPKDGLDIQVIKSRGPVQGSGLRYVPVEHSGNQNCSPEEAVAVRDLVTSILQSGSTWIDRDNNECPVALSDIVIITPYNAQVFEIQQRLPNARVGTVDKFQGQEAPIAIYSMATSSHVDAPRGMEFLYSLNRLNVATSRAKCISIIVSSPQLLEAECRTPRQIQLVNAFCRFIELAETIEPTIQQSSAVQAQARQARG